MYKATFEIGWRTVECKASTLNELIWQLNDVQDLRCLIYQGMYMGMGTPKDKTALKRLEAFYDKWLCNELEESDVRKLKIKLSLGDLVCTHFEVTDEW